MTTKPPYYTPDRYIARHPNGQPFPQVFDTHRNEWHRLPGRTTWTDAHKTAAAWNAGILTTAEARTIAQHFMTAAAWASAPEGTNPRPTASAMATARTMACEFVAGLGVPLFRACLDAYEAWGLYPDCNGDPCAAFGHDLFMTLEGHGVGFWDRDALLLEPTPEEAARLGLASGQTIGGRITEACNASAWRDPCGSGCMEFYMGWIYYRPAHE